MKKTLFILPVFSLLLVSCGFTNSTTFEKFKATVTRNAARTDQPIYSYCSAETTFRLGKIDGINDDIKREIKVANPTIAALSIEVIDFEDVSPLNPTNLEWLSPEMLPEGVTIEFYIGSGDRLKVEGTTNTRSSSTEFVYSKVTVEYDKYNYPVFEEEHCTYKVFDYSGRAIGSYETFTKTIISYIKG